MSGRALPIRPMTTADVEPAADLLRTGDFGDRREFFRWAIEQPAIDVLVAADRGGIRATGVASAHGNAGWVGVIFVAPDARGSGRDDGSPGRSSTGSRGGAAGPRS
jgi:hypothetical protein